MIGIYAGRVISGLSCICVKGANRAEHSIHHN